jgi:hypothetical protein
MAYSLLSAITLCEFVMGSFHKHRDSPTSESAVPIRKLSGLLLRGSLVFSCVGVAAIFAGMLVARYGSDKYFSAGHIAMLAGVAAVLYLGFLPALLGVVLRMFAKRIAKLD